MKPLDNYTFEFNHTIHQPTLSSNASAGRGTDEETGLTK